MANNPGFLFHAPRTHFQTQKNENQVLENAILKI